MSDPADGSSGPAAALRARWRGGATVVVIVALVVLLGAVSGDGNTGGPPLDPTSTAPAGAKALAVLLGQLGVGVDQAVAAPPAGSGGIALVLQDRLDAAGDRRLTEWVRRGGTLVVADLELVVTFAPPARRPGPGGLEGLTGSLLADCELPAMRGITSVDVPSGVALRPPSGAVGCFHTSGGGAFMVVQPLGSGQLVLLGGPEIWTNAAIGREDNSVLAANLLAPRPGGPPLQWIVGPRAGGGHKSLLQLMPSRVKEGLIQLLVALVLLALWRGRRLGRPVLETPAVELPGSELVVAVGNLLQQGGRYDDAAAILRGTVRRTVVDRLGVPPNATPDTMADVVAARTGLDREMILATVAGPPPAGEAELVALARQIDIIRQEMAHVR